MRWEPRTKAATPLVGDPACPVCLTDLTAPRGYVHPYDYWDCTRCRSTFVHPDQRPTARDEADHYRLHDNRVDDPRFRDFLGRLAAPLLAHLAHGCEGLDFGCGPGPALAQMLREAGQQVTLYDPLFHPDPGALDKHYDFIVLSEVAEHLHNPAGIFATLFGLLKPGGIMAIMTGFPPDDDEFPNWHYRRDPTHVVFYRPETLMWLATRFCADCEIPCVNVALIRGRS